MVARVGAWVGIDGCVSNGIARNRPSPRLIALTSPPPATVAIHDSVRQAIAVFFFRRSRLFFREAAFFLGGEGCEWRAQRATVGKSGDKAENSFSGFIPLAVPRKGFSPHIPASRLFVHFHTTMPTTPQPHNPHQPTPKIATFPIGIALRAHHP